MLKEEVLVENMALLKEISQLKLKRNELYSHSGPNSSNYVDITLKLNRLVHQYIDEKIENLLSH